MGAEEGKEYQEGSEGLHLLYGLMERRREAKERLPGLFPRMSREEAQEKARALKREALGLSPIAPPECRN